MVDGTDGGVDLITGRVETASKRPDLSNRVTPKRLPLPGWPFSFPTLGFGLPSRRKWPCCRQIRCETGSERIDVGRAPDKAVLQTQAHGNLMTLAPKAAISAGQDAVDKLRGIAVEPRPAADG